MPSPSTDPSPEAIRAHREIFGEITRAEAIRAVDALLGAYDGAVLAAEEWSARAVEAEAELGILRSRTGAHPEHDH